MDGITHLLSTASSYLQEADLEVLRKAYDFARERHEGRLHESGDTYIDHLLAVASSLAALHLDTVTIMAGLLHGILKEEVATVEELEERFGTDITNIVSSITRITRIRYNAKLANQAENLRRLLLAMGADIRVLLVKLADRLQDMLTLDSASEERRRQVARETMDLYAPLAGRLGIDWIKRELEDYSFKYLFPTEYRYLTRHIEESHDERQAYVDEVISILQQKLLANQVRPIRIMGRPKQLYSIYKKLVAQKIPLEKVYDKVAFRIIVNTVKECYEVLGTVHADWTPVSGRIKDFIANPKSNNYQSLHTTVVGPGDHFIEIQIRTEEMDRIAQEGVAAHWAYKEGQAISTGDAKLFKNLKQLVHTLQEVEDPGEFIESVRSELFEPDVYALTPTGEVRELPRGSTPIDFAYAIHSHVGDTCTGARVNGQLVSLKYELQSGDIVEILTQKNQQPKRAWLQLVKTGRARTRIRAYLRREEREKSLKLGREICERELKKYEMTLKRLVKSGHLRALLKDLRCNTLDEMLIKVGSGAVTVGGLFKALQPEEFKEAEERRRSEEMLERVRQVEGTKKPVTREGIDIVGVDNLLLRIGQCCRPVPGDEIMGFITMGNGVAVHKADCANLLKTDPQRWLDVSWSSSASMKYQVGLLIRTENRKNILGDISSTLNADDAEILELKAKTIGGNMAEFHVLLEVADLGHLHRVQQRLQQMPEVIEVHRR
ncbi:MAG: GTP pyrophosphokinase [Desulfobulbus propionicus]|nr:MAG: GTP pyrophosphokinase [Desulfobulbus propionicus]